MDDKTLTALRGSIAKWQAIIDGTGQDRGTENCPLCAEFYNNQCFCCPVRERTGKWGCAGSPYANWAAIYYDDIVKRDFANKPILTGLAQAELDFLTNLLPDLCPDCHSEICKPGCPSRLP